MEPHHQPQQPSPASQPTDRKEEVATDQKGPFHFTTEGMPNVIAKKTMGLVQILNRDVIDLEGLKKHLAEGIPDEAAIVRQYCWKLVLGYLPEDKSKWQTTIQKQAQTYSSLVKMFLPQQKFEDYPLWLRKGHPRFEQLQADYLLWQQIQKDTSRTHAQFSFFATASTEIMLPYLTAARRQKFKLINGDDDISYKQFLADKQKQRKTYRYDYMTRILYVYSKLNPKIQYVQGMNEILAPIFYLVNVTKPSNAIEEASCFFMFNNAICEIIELHIKDFDKSKNGIHGKLNQVSDMLIALEPEIWKRMQELKIDPFFYCFRWVTLLYAQDFPLFDTLRIWESIFSSDNRMQFIKFFAIAILRSCRQFIEENQFTAVLEHLQDIQEHIVINDIINIANQFVQLYGNSDFAQLAEKGKKRVQKQWDREKKQRDREIAKEERQREKEEQKQRRKSEKLKMKEEKGEVEVEEKGKGEEDTKEELKGGEEKEEKDTTKKVQKKIGGFFKKMGNMVDKFLN